MTPEQLKQKLESKHHFTAESGLSLSFIDGKVYTETNLTADYVIIAGHSPNHFRMEFSNLQRTDDSERAFGSDFNDIVIVIENDPDFPVFINSTSMTPGKARFLKGFDHPTYVGK